MGPLSTALSGLQTEAKRLAVSADNVANARSLGHRVTSEGDNGGFRPARVISQPLPGGGVTGQVVPIEPASVLVPGSQAGEAGLVALANVNLAEEFVSQILAQRAYEASAQLVREEEARVQVTLSLLS